MRIYQVPLFFFIYVRQQSSREALGTVELDADISPETTCRQKEYYSSTSTFKTKFYEAIC